MSFILQILTCKRMKQIYLPSKLRTIEVIIGDTVLKLMCFAYTAQNSERIFHFSHSC